MIACNRSAFLCVPDFQAQTSRTMNPVNLSLERRTTQSFSGRPVPACSLNSYFEGMSYA